MAWKPGVLTVPEWLIPTDKDLGILSEKGAIHAEMLNVVQGLSGCVGSGVLLSHLGKDVREEAISGK